MPVYEVDQQTFRAVAVVTVPMVDQVGRRSPSMDGQRSLYCTGGAGDVGGGDCALWRMREALRVTEAMDL